MALPICIPLVRHLPPLPAYQWGTRSRDCIGRNEMNGLKTFTAVLLFTAGAALAEHGGETNREKIAAVQAAKVPLSEAIALAERASGGKVAKIEIDREEGAVAYEVKTLGSEGKVRLLLDAATGKVLRNERKDASGKGGKTAMRLRAGERDTRAG